MNVVVAVNGNTKDICDVLFKGLPCFAIVGFHGPRSWSSNGLYFIRGPKNTKAIDGLSVVVIVVSFKEHFVDMTSTFFCDI